MHTFNSGNCSLIMEIEINNAREYKSDNRRFFIEKLPPNPSIDLQFWKQKNAKYCVKCENLWVKMNLGRIDHFLLFELGRKHSFSFLLFPFDESILQSFAQIICPICHLGLKWEDLEEVPL